MTDTARHTQVLALTHVNTDRYYTLISASDTRDDTLSHGERALPRAPPVSTLALAVSVDPDPAGHPGSVGCK